WRWPRPPSAGSCASARTPPPAARAGWTSRPRAPSSTRSSSTPPWRSASAAPAAGRGSAAGGRGGRRASSSTLPRRSRARARAEAPSAAVRHFYAALGGRLGDRLRDLTFCRQRLRHIQEALTLPEGPEDWDADQVGDTLTFARTPGPSGFGAGASLTPAPLLS